MNEELNFQGDHKNSLPPQNIEAEEAILGGILLDPEAINRVSDRLVPEAFYISTHSIIYQAALRLHAQQKPTDLLTITNWLTDHDQLTKIGGRNKLATLIDRTVSAVNIDALAELVMEKYLRRQLIKAGNEIVQLGYQTETELPIVLDQAEQKVFNVTQEKPQTGLVHISDTLIHTFDDIDSRHQGIALPGIPCGFYDLDAMTTGFQRSDLIIVAGRPSMGKCLSYDSEIVLENGEISTIQEIYQNRQGSLLTLNENWQFTITQPSAFVDDGIKPVFRVTTRLGRAIETTITHPYLTIQGWQKLEQFTQLIYKETYQISCDVITNLANSDVYWDEIISIEFVGNKQVYDLTIPQTHNFVANDICVHNTAFCLNLAHNIAAGYQLPVAVFSLEMSKEQLVQRLLASEARIESSYLRTGRIAQNQWEDLSRAISLLAEIPIFIDDTPNITVTQMRSQARRLQAEQNANLGLIVIDYLQLMEGAGDNRVQELSRITRSLKGLARELSVPVIALSQLSRGVEARTNKRPMLSDLRESGSIEQDADIVMMLYRDEYYSPDTPDRGIAEVIVAKHRNGPTGTVKLLFDPQFTKFKNLAKPNNW